MPGNSEWTLEKLIASAVRDAWDRVAADRALESRLGMRDSGAVIK